MIELLLDIAIGCCIGLMLLITFTTVALTLLLFICDLTQRYERDDKK